MASYIVHGEIMSSEVYAETMALLKEGQITAGELWEGIQRHIRREIRAERCIACEENDVDLGLMDYGDDPTDPANPPLLCTTCMQDALTYIGVNAALQRIEQFDVPLSRAVYALAQHDYAMHALCAITGVPYNDLESSALDSLYGDSLDDLRDKMANTLAPFVLRCTS